MAKTVTLKLIDDIDYMRANATVTFNFDGSSFEVDKHPAMQRS
jgi:Lsr2 protein